MRPSPTERAIRLAAALRHLGFRQALRNLRRRSLDRLRSLERYAPTTRCDLELRGAARAPFGPDHGDAGPRLEGDVFHAVGESRRVGDPPDWETPGSALWQFNWHYFGFLGALPDDEARRLVLDWIERYPPHARRPGWAPYPVSLRLRSWMRRLLSSPGWVGREAPRILGSIEGQANSLADRVELHFRGNHLLENAVTLKLLAAAFRGGSVELWGRTADRILETELDEQFLPDGGHVERSPMYHGLLVSGLLDLVNVLPEEDPLRERLVERIPGMLGFLAAIRHPDGEIGLFNDAALGVAPAPGDVLGYAQRLGLSASPRSTFPQTGYAVRRDASSCFIMDCGPIGPDYVPAHAHADIFSFELSVAGRRLVVDGGTPTYAAGAERDWLRSTRAHSTVEIEGHDQCEVFGAFRVGRRGRPRDVEIEESAAGLVVGGWHDGYARLPGGPLHRREAHALGTGRLVVWDVVRSSRPVRCESRVRFAPGARVEPRDETSFAIELEGRRFQLATVGAAGHVVEDRYAPRFGELVPTRSVVMRTTNGEPFGFALADTETPIEIRSHEARVGDHRISRRFAPP